MITDHEKVKSAAFGDGSPAAARGRTGAAERPLVTTAKSSGHFREEIDEKTGEIQGFRLNLKRREFDPVSDPDQARFSRFALQKSAAKLLPNHRVSKCIRSLAGGGEVAILQSLDNDKCHFGGLQTCGSVWSCPICAAKISERRRAELREVFDTHMAAGGGVEMVTLTFPHQRTDVLKTLLLQLRDALKRFKTHRQYKTVRRLYESVGSIRALETTHGQNGWHPHIHEIWLFAKPLTVAERTVLRNSLFAAWKASCLSAGFPAPNRQRGVHVQQAESAAEYIAKWGCEPKWEAACELTKANIKKSRSSKGSTPFDLLRRYADGDAQAGALFAEYSEAFFGYRQLFWSPGLKNLFGIADLTDEEIAAQQIDRAKEVCRITKAEWRAVLAIPFDSRATLLALAENGGYDAVRFFIDGLRCSDD